MSIEALLTGITASESLASLQHYCVAKHSATQVREANAAGDALLLAGILKNAPASGEPAEVWGPGSKMVPARVNGTADIAVGDRLKPDVGNTTGVLIVTVTNNDMYIAIAQEAMTDNAVREILVDVERGFVGA